MIPNIIISHTNAAVERVEPFVGMGATQYVGSDRYPWFVSRVISPKACEVQRATFRRTDANGEGEAQAYDIAPDPKGETRIVTLRKNGRWIPKGSELRCGEAWILGKADAYRDPSF